MTKNNHISQHLVGVFTPPASHLKLQLDYATRAQRHCGIPPLWKRLLITGCQLQVWLTVKFAEMLIGSDHWDSGPIKLLPSFHVGSIGSLVGWKQSPAQSASSSARGFQCWSSLWVQVQPSWTWDKGQKSVNGSDWMRSFYVRSAIAVVRSWVTFCSLLPPRQSFLSALQSWKADSTVQYPSSWVKWACSGSSHWKEISPDILMYCIQDVFFF